mmetsp:Transcript_76869/g.178285  ORF Transcript_76869/g.178285 Transcript_76869/m.178285 type:complete len:349 (-) Transcript_76869:8-1054(-)
MSIMGASDDTCKAVMVERISSTAKEGIEATVLRDIPRKPSLGDHEVRIEVRSASLNFPELLLMQNKYQYKPALPFVLTMEGAGVVSEVGKKVSRCKVGDRVFYNWQGCACEELVVPEFVCYQLPPGFTFSQGAGFYLGYTTAYHALVHRGHLKAGECLLVTGAGGGMGLMAVELGKALGAKVIAAASSDDKLEACKRLGADHVVNYSKESLKDAVGKITNGDMCDVIYEPVGGGIFDQCVRCVTPRGYARLLVIGFASGTIPKFPINMALIKGFDLVGVRMGAQMGLQQDLHQDMMTHLLRMANDGKLKPYVSVEFPVDDFKKAFYHIEERKVIGKSCLTFGPARSRL